MYTFKRMVDIVVSLILIVLLLPFFIIIPFLILLETGGPVFYYSHRVGRYRNVFNMFKFRTMRPGSDHIDEVLHLNKYKSDGPFFFKSKQDPRVTNVGRILRASALDEIPQLFNVLIGDMSIVGNRPLPVYEANLLEGVELERFHAPAGITGLWQVQSLKKFVSATNRINLDIEYSRRWNLKLDWIIMYQTMRLLIRKQIIVYRFLRMFKLISIGIKPIRFGIKWMWMFGYKTSYVITKTVNRFR